MAGNPQNISIDMGRTTIYRIDLGGEWEKYVIRWRKENDKVELKVVYSDNYEEIRPGTVLTIDYKEFEECINKYRELRANKPQDEAVRDFIFYGECLAGNPNEFGE
jgi:hypothetical protein